MKGRGSKGKGVTLFITLKAAPSLLRCFVGPSGPVGSGLSTPGRLALLALARLALSTAFKKRGEHS